MTQNVILAINAGSSSVKVSLYLGIEGQEPKQIADVEVSGLSSPPTKLKYSCHGQQKAKNKVIDNSKKVDSQDAALEYILQTLFTDKDLDEVSSKDDVSHVAHRVVHGGNYTKPEPINNETLQTLEHLTDLAPLHNASALQIVKTCMQKLPKAQNIAVFDSQFHQTIPEHVRTIPIDQDIAKKNKLRKYGFHGISYAFILKRTAAFLGKDVGETSIIALHLGSGASACVIQNGSSINTTMSLTPLDGLPGATRSGAVDPSLVFHYASNVGKLAPDSTKDLHISKAEKILNKESGWKALTGTTDFGEIAKRDTKEKKLAFDILVDRVTQYVGAYYVSLQGKCDALVFAGGIGEKSDELRAAICAQVSCLGFQLDESKNGKDIQDIVQDIGTDARKGSRVLVCQTDEQFEMAQSCLSI
ncbi:Probable acetate kinase [Taphrina deformans PYCC 5710]|uniref:Probable acetate kinase n=1 Tax=Taphrina deformans (strain PYCC 5710 / ATCC 11124 / CBS 356.35 / IMI 108563 / JCM 9778 / NBRC 8474) TaxID=1097556 RepID=R4XA18_TAPDE|nr:Probable acetate kinase [Taphrina deformans PYCC 5710]|eukprot:CCG82367.1 Probable acetate kinase [Taphrina deformans PYCC 5710]